MSKVKTPKKTFNLFKRFVYIINRHAQHIYQNIFRITADGDDRITTDGDIRITADSDY